jgi:hypothetical protein
MEVLKPFFKVVEVPASKIAGHIMQLPARCNKMRGWCGLASCTMCCAGWPFLIAAREISNDVSRSTTLGMENVRMLIHNHSSQSLCT